MVRFRPEAPNADLAHLVERHLAKVEVASSSLVIRSKKGAVKKVPKKKGCDLAKKQDSSLFLWYN